MLDDLNFRLDFMPITYDRKLVKYFGSLKTSLAFEDLVALYESYIDEADLDISDEIEHSTAFIFEDGNWWMLYSNELVRKRLDISSPMVTRLLKLIKSKGWGDYRQFKYLTNKRVTAWCRYVTLDLEKIDSWRTSLDEKNPTAGAAESQNNVQIEKKFHNPI